MRLPIILSALAALSGLLAFPFSLRSFSRKALGDREYSYPKTRFNASEPYCPGYPAPEAYQRQIFFNFINDLYIKKDVVGAFKTYIALNLTEHDPFDAQGRIPNEETLVNIIPYVPFIVLRMSFDNNIGFAHVKVDQADEEPISLADIYRMNGTCIVEHWDVTQARPANATNPIAMF